MDSQVTVIKLAVATRSGRLLSLVRPLLPMGWVVATLGYFGPWIGHQTAALTLSGVDMGEFVKFLPGVVDGSLQVARQLLYLAPFSVVVSIALLSSLTELKYPWPLRTSMLLLAIPVSLQLLPPAWAPSTLLSAEFRLQTIAMGLCWLLLAASWLLGRLPSWLVGSLSAAISLGALILLSWQLVVAKPAIDDLYRIPPAIGWGVYLCLGGLALTTTASAVVMLGTRARRLAP